LKGAWLLLAALAQASTARATLGESEASCERVKEALHGTASSTRQDEHYTHQNVNPATMGMNGILGVSLLKQDCGPTCTAVPENGSYYSCAGATCTPTTTTVQLQNPVAALPTDNNGLVFALPDIPDEGAPNATGQLILGVGTRANNQPTGAVALPATSNGTFAAISAAFAAGGAGSLTSFFDSGSALMYFPTVSTLPVCTGDLAMFLCPATTQTMTATVSGSPPSTTSLPLTFKVANPQTLFQGSSATFMAFNDLAGASPASFQNAYLDWGLTFFYGRRIYFGIEGMSSPLGPGPYYGL